MTYQHPPGDGETPWGDPPAAPPTAQTPAVPPTGPPAVPAHGWQPPPAAPYGNPAPQNPFDSETTPILVTGILSLVLCGPVGLYAWLKGNDLRNRAQAAGWPEPGIGKVGRILGIVGTIIFGFQVLMGILWLVLVLVLAGSSTAT